MAVPSQIHHFHFSNCLMNASGVSCERKEELAALDDSAAGTFITKTATLEAREGNPQPRVETFALGSINSSGLPNQGLPYYLQALADFQAAKPDKIYFLSVTELEEEKIYKILEEVEASDFKGLVELNLSCPNVIGKPQIAYDFETTDRILKRVFSFFTKSLGVKLPPFFDPSHFDQMADILNAYPLAYVNCINSVGNGLVIHDEQVVIKPKQGFGGIGGETIKATALANVHAFYQRLRPEIAIIGTGGVCDGRDVFEHILCGASMVGVGTTLYEEGEGCFASLTEELEAIMKEKGYKTIEDFRGKLKYMD
ncbi:dihydroorotate oxidase [Aerococcus sanguinicola]|uniref:dihydroorotate oxidase n=1 Tax=unclassified Aerococcus TaxID=2618060 RepID=UPI0008A3E51F|nr:MULTISPECIES: dihydroorotate oxidase [unclassified Aerococcus]MDK6232684.1 dihydroorotate oxidase [Aerococcus sp. UMB10185]MDK6855026.1 dihydroorotate oxidase [Aerococcus sp. UMB7533]MDK8501708.1 dihydroorotate oxidase [Aerococcus sp. UMB1112A]OFN02782.1 dihydroorotate dehydrogenase [Aerococcus sp. HMSC062A02]OHO45549.1 dihydroorotate dehydrogenase [Aerococcus sp. HMSC035B07]